MKAILLAMLLVLVPLQVHAEFLSGNDLVQYMREADKANASHPQASYYDVGNYMGFVTGVYDAYSTARLICPGSGVTRGQALEIVTVYLKSSPTKWNLSAVVLVRNALTSAFPCR